MTSTRTGSKRLLRDLNQSIVLNLIADRGAISRTELANRSGLPAATITRIVNEFLMAGLVRQGAPEESSGGRRPVLLNINPAAGYVMGIKLRATSLTAVLCDLQCTVLRVAEEDFSGQQEPYKIVEIMADTVKRCLNDAGVDAQHVLGVGVGLAGLIDSVHGICRYSPMLHWQNVELAPALSFKLHLPVRIDNDVNTLAVAERQFGAGRESADFILVTIGTGIGLGIVIRGELYRGFHGWAGEVGHMTVDTAPEAPLCNCGKRGCLEAIVANYGVVRAATGEERVPSDKTLIATLVEQARSGDERVQAVFQRAGVALGTAVANLVNIFDPGRVLIGGEGLRAGDLILKSMRDTISLHTLGPPREDISVVVQMEDEVTWARGAASLILRELFQPPIYENQEGLVIQDLLSRATQKRTRKG